MKSLEKYPEDKDLLQRDCASVTQEEVASASSKCKYETLQVSTEDNITKIMLNRPMKKNAVTLVMYREIMQALEEAAKDDSVITVVTGSGDYYSSGNDLNNFTENLEQIIKNNGEWIKNFVNHFIDFPKPLVAGVNGPALGISVTLLGLFDIVYATNRGWFPDLYGSRTTLLKSELRQHKTDATFQTPFIQLGQTPEGCSTYTFPKIMGTAKANEMLLFNKKLTAREACAQGLVTEVFPDQVFQEEVWRKLKAFASLPKNSLALSKQLIRSVEKEKLYAVNSQECEQIVKKYFSKESMNAFKSFFQKKSKNVAT